MNGLITDHDDRREQAPTRPPPRGRTPDLPSGVLGGAVDDRCYREPAWTGRSPEPRRRPPTTRATSTASAWCRYRPAAPRFAPRPNPSRPRPHRCAHPGRRPTGEGSVEPQPVSAASPTRATSSRTGTTRAVLFRAQNSRSATWKPNPERHRAQPNLDQISSIHAEDWKQDSRSTRLILINVH
jgi:hypothetical protein